MSVSFSLIRYNEFLSVRDHELAQFAVCTKLQKPLLISHKTAAGDLLEARVVNAVAASVVRVSISDFHVEKAPRRVALNFAGSVK